MSTNDILPVAGCAIAAIIVAFALRVRMRTVLMAPLAYVVQVALAVCAATAHDPLTQGLAATGLLASLAALMVIVLVGERAARESEIEARWRQFERAFRRHVAELEA